MPRCLLAGNSFIRLRWARAGFLQESAAAQSTPAGAFLKAVISGAGLGFLRVIRRIPFSRSPANLRESGAGRLRRSGEALGFRRGLARRRPLLPISRPTPRRKALRG